MSPKKTKKCVYALIFEKCIIYVYIFGRFSSLFFSFIGHNDIIAYNSLCSKSVILFFFIIHFMLFFFGSFSYPHSSQSSTVLQSFLWNTYKNRFNNEKSTGGVEEAPKRYTFFGRTKWKVLFNFSFPLSSRHSIHIYTIVIHLKLNKRRILWNRNRVKERWDEHDDFGLFNTFSFQRSTLRYFSGYSSVITLHKSSIKTQHVVKRYTIRLPVVFSSLFIPPPHSHSSNISSTHYDSLASTPQHIRCCTYV